MTDDIKLPCGCYDGGGYQILCDYHNTTYELRVLASKEMQDKAGRKAPMNNCNVDSRAADAVCETHHREFFFCLRERLQEVNLNAALSQERYIKEISDLKRHLKEMVDGIVNSPTKHEKLVIETYSNEERLKLLRVVEAARYFDEMMPHGFGEAVIERRDGVRRVLTHYDPEVENLHRALSDLDSGA